MAGKLTAKQQRFVDEYMVDMNGKQAAIRAGYAPRSAEVTASKLLRNAKVAAAIEERQKTIADKLGVTAERVIAELAKIGFSDLRAVFGESGNLRSIHDLPDDIAAAVSSVEVITKPGVDVDDEGERCVEHVHKIRLWDKRASLVDLGKHLGLFVERKKVEVSGHQTVEHIGVSETDRRIERLLAGGKDRDTTPALPH